MRVNAVRGAGETGIRAPELFYEAMRAIKRVEPGTYGRMMAADWNVTVVTQDAHELQLLADTVDPSAAVEIIDALNAGAFGITIPDTEINHRGRGWEHVVQDTWLNWPALVGVARDEGYDVAGYAAATIVHEFAHHEGAYDEAPAYDAGTRFSRKFGDLRAARASEMTKQRIVAEGKDRMMGPEDDSPFREPQSLDDLIRLLTGA